MKRSSILTITLAAATCLTTAVWAEHGGAAGVHGGGGHGEAPEFHGDTSHSGSKTSGTGSGAAANFQARLAGNTGLATRLQPLLPPNTTLQAAAQGFKNQGQFIAALHVAHNLNIPFDQLKSEMTGAGHDSLGHAIHDLRPDLTGKGVHSNVKLADHQAKNDVEESNETSEPSGN